MSCNINTKIIFRSILISEFLLKKGLTHAKVTFSETIDLLKSNNGKFFLNA